MSEFIGQPEPRPVNPSSFQEVPIKPGDSFSLGTTTTYELPIESRPTAWQSLPGTVRFAVWLWAVTSIAGSTVGVAALVALAAGWLS